MDSWWVFLLLLTLEISLPPYGVTQPAMTGGVSHLHIQMLKVIAGSSGCVIGVPFLHIRDFFYLPPFISMSDSFVFYRLMYETGMKLQDPSMRLQYFEAVLNYGLNGILPDDPVMQALINGAVFSIDRSKKISAINSANGKNHTGNQYTRQREKRNQQKQANKPPMERIGTTGSELEQNGTEVRSIEVGSIEDKKLEENKNKKEKYMDFVFLTADEHTRLLEKLGSTKTQYWIDRLNSYIGQIGVGSASKKYKSHYFTILNWERREGGKTSSDFAKDQALARHREKIREQIDEYLHPIDSANVGVEKQNQAFDRRGEVLST